MSNKHINGIGNFGLCCQHSVHQLTDSGLEGLYSGLIAFHLGKWIKDKIPGWEDGVTVVDSTVELDDVVDSLFGEQELIQHSILVVFILVSCDTNSKKVVGVAGSVVSNHPGMYCSNSLVRILSPIGNKSLTQTGIMRVCLTPLTVRVCLPWVVSLTNSRTGLPSAISASDASCYWTLFLLIFLVHFQSTSSLSLPHLSPSCLSFLCSFLFMPWPHS